MSKDYEKKQIIIAFLTFIILITTLYIPQVVNNDIELKVVKSGYPLPFLTGDCSQYDPPYPYGFTALCVIRHNFPIIKTEQYDRFMANINTALGFDSNDKTKLKLRVIEVLDKSGWYTVKAVFLGIVSFSTKENQSEEKETLR